MTPREEQLEQELRDLAKALRASAARVRELEYLRDHWRATACGTEQARAEERDEPRLQLVQGGAT